MKYPRFKEWSLKVLLILVVVWWAVDCLIAPFWTAVRHLGVLLISILGWMGWNIISYFFRIIDHLDKD